MSHRLQNRVRYQAIRDEPSVVIDHRNNAWQIDLPRAPRSREEDKVQDLQATPSRSFDVSEEVKHQSENHNNRRPAQRHNRRDYLYQDLEDLQLQALLSESIAQPPNREQEGVFGRNSISIDERAEQLRLVNNNN